ncbi:metalloregulator ArsR/SmtB family transcription factor [Halomonas kenyensis]|uniref:Metalloregulator ArsR/SmtB family transcription factor n=1 Tax=Billgrantia kenyensis TaxID=321266 RepID=A0A7V9W075_9GAMM|nr:metalloregulator ArsR/SmtB family transcription factor [Halomonas kenyensis]MBA2778642.1 metalloregulator ArsR/SmtB family transcription factor [Halomonas kenyensis]MCG6661553.1 metalloregulator ArsR/SmtB family transcription factor [Halomonas kenyensis]
MILLSNFAKGTALTLLEPARLLKCLGDETRLTLTLLILREQELCVCEMTHALEESQPKVSRHLAQLRSCGLLSDRREGQWVYYRLSDELPGWVAEVLAAAEKGEAPRLASLQERLREMGNRPERRAALC